MYVTGESVEIRVRRAVAAAIGRARLVLERPSSPGGAVGKHSAACRRVRSALGVRAIVQPLLVVARRGGCSSALRVTPGAAIAGVATELVIEAGFDLVAHARGELDRAELVRRVIVSALVAGGSALVLGALAWVTLSLAPGLQLTVMVVGGLLVGAIF